MREIKIKGKPYIIKFTHKAAKCQNCVQRVFELATGAIAMGSLPTDREPTLADMINATSAQVAMIPALCDTMMYAGLKAENPVATEEEAGDLLIEYMEETGKGYVEIFESFKECMEEDGFFKIAGIEEMVKNMSESIRATNEPMETTVEEPEKSKKTTKKTTSQK